MTGVDVGAAATVRVDVAAPSTNGVVVVAESYSVASDSMFAVVTVVVPTDLVAICPEIDAAFALEPVVVLPVGLENVVSNESHVLFSAAGIA